VDLSMKSPFLTEEVAREGYLWCKAKRHWTWQDFCRHMWSNECSAERGKGKAGEWAFCTPPQKWQKEMITTYEKGKDISVMVWDCIWWHNGLVQKSDLVIMERDPESKRNGYTAQSYLNVLDDQKPRCWQLGLIFMQDNAPIHSAHVVRDCFTENAIPVVDWPPYSPDLNPIEHIWFHLKNKVLKLHPELEHIGSGDEAKDALENALIEAWEAIDDSIIESCLERMPRRRDAVLKAKGCYTKY
jgi:hypothetical protein